MDAQKTAQEAKQWKKDIYLNAEGCRNKSKVKGRKPGHKKGPVTWLTKLVLSKFNTVFQ